MRGAVIALVCCALCTEAAPKHSTSKPSARKEHKTSFPIDMVFTWYNSNDIKSQHQYKERLEQIDQSELPPGTIELKRHFDAGELRYNLRALEQNANWFRKLFLVIANDMELPTWLTPSSPRLHIVRHSEIFASSSSLPTFNSHAIESRLHMIPGLAEHFIYLNDDTFINRKVGPGTFFTSAGKAKVWPGYIVNSSPEAHNVAESNAIKLVNTKIWPYLTTLTHNIKALRRSGFVSAHKMFEDSLSQTELHPFRTKSDVWPILLASVVCVEEDNCVVEQKVPSDYFAVLTDVPVGRAMEEISQGRPVFFCLNDSGPGDAAELQTTLSKHFPIPSSFETDV